MKVAFVVPRYGAEVRGGAETGARMLAEHLVADRGAAVEVFTTCARDALTWDNELAEGTVTERGVVVHRVASAAGRQTSFHPLSALLLADPARVPEDQARQWLDWQGPLAPALVDAVAASDADVIAFYPYLYYPTVRGLPRVRDRAIMHPAAHEEPALHLPIFRDLFEMCRGFVFHSASERRLVESLFGVATTPQVTIGLGVDEVDGDAAAAAPFLDEKSPYLVCIGRVDDKKGTGVLWRYFETYKARHRAPLKLVLVGQVVDAPAPSDHLVVTGVVDDATKWALLRGARALVAPSPVESFSLQVIEAMTAGTPVLVNATCGPTREHCERSGAGLWFGGFAEFDAALERLVTDDALHAAMAGNGRRYVDANYRWPVVLDRYCNFLEAWGPRQGKGVP